MRGLTAFTALLAASLASAQSKDSPACAFEVGAPVNTTSGRVLGHRAPNATQVSEYLGIPYAKPPVGDLRFAAPQAYKSNRTINATSFGHDCAININNVPTFLTPNVYNILSQLAQVGDNPAEDCLFVNVWSKPQSGSARKPVLVWIYGGGFNIGGTNTSAYSGQFWAETEDVVFVNFNYRLNIFGFPGAPNEVANAALLDQRLAIEWVRDNIAAFGGDPQRITIFGQSAGSASVDLYNYAWTADPIIAGSITQSGTASSFGNKVPATAANAWYTVTKKLGCGDQTSNQTQVLACMRAPNVTTAKILNATSSGDTVNVLGNFGPTIDNKTVFQNYTELGLQGKFIKKPYLGGNNVYESGLFSLITAGSGISYTREQWENATTRGFTCPAATSTEFRAAANVPVWRYIYGPEFPNEKLPTSYGLAWHGAEILPMFGSSEEITKQDSTWQERTMGRYMRGAWSAFAACPESGLARYGWPMYSNTTTTLLQLGFANVSSTTFSPGPTFNSSKAFDVGCPPFPYMGAGNL